MSRLCLFSFLLVSIGTIAQRKWDGGGGDGQWNNALNWAGDAVPFSTDDVILDNSMVPGNYTVTLPAGMVMTTVKSVTILPGASKNIELILPATNTQVPGLVIIGPGYGLDIGSGGIFRNASRASSGTPVSVGDSIRIRNGGRYVHNTARAHAANVQVLSAAPGTEKGILEFDVPAVSSTLSLSGRVFGTLELAARSVARNALKYTAAGTNGARIRGDLQIDSGVALGLNFSDTITVLGDLINFGKLDLGNTARNVVLSVNGNTTQASSGSITETGSGIQQLLLSGRTAQSLDLKGTITNNVALKLQTTVVFLLSALTLPYELILASGTLRTTASALLITGPGCTVFADTLQGISFVDGPMKKTGLSNSSFVFPIGKGIAMRWMGVDNATGDFTAEYFPQDPYSLSTTVDPAINHVSHIEYWTLAGDAAGSCAVRLSFNDPGSGGVTDLADLRTARLAGAAWQNEGNTASAGSAGANGWVSSLPLNGWGSGNHYLALASVSGTENPLPLSTVFLKAQKLNGQIRFNWTIVSDTRFVHYELQRATTKSNFTTIFQCTGKEGSSQYSFNMPDENAHEEVFRIKAVDERYAIVYSNRVSVRNNETGLPHFSGASVVHQMLTMDIGGSPQGSLNLCIYGSDGRLVRRSIVEVQKDQSTLSMNVSDLSVGVYIISGTTNSGRMPAFRFVKY